MSHLLHLDSSLRTEGSRSRDAEVESMADALAAIDALLEV